MNKIQLRPILTLILILSIGSLLAQKQAEDIDMNEFIAETQIDQSAQNTLEFVWWIPIEMWQIAFAAEKTMTQEQKDEFIQLLKPYTLVAVVDGDMNEMGDITYESEEKTRERIQVRMDIGETLHPLGPTDIPQTVQDILNALSPMLSNMIGAMGENMHFFVFSDENRKRNRQLDPLDAKKSFSVFLTDDFDVRFELPLSSLLDNKTCPVDGREHEGTWKYCPYHGAELD